jgi:hypothetical protein
VKESFGDEAGVEARYQELLGLLEEQMAAVEAAFTDEMQAQEEKDAIARDSCLAPEDETANMVLRLEAGLDRAIDRKVRILLTMRKEQARECRGGSRTAPTEPSAIPPEAESNDREAEELSNLVGLEASADTPSSVCDSGQDSEAPPSPRETETPNGGGVRQPANLPSENAGETPKSPEQSENVIENKASVAEAVEA